MRKIVALLFILVPASQNVSAADWQVNQTASIASLTFNMTQGGTTSSRQAVNASVIAQGDSLASVTQRVTFNGTNVTLSQDGSATGSATNPNVQTVNLASAPSILQLEQIVEDFDSVTLTQDVATGTNNVQALNYAEAEGTISDATQTVDGGDLRLIKTAPGNIQAVNYMKAQRYSGEISQMSVLSDATLDTLSPTLGNFGFRINSINGDTATADIVQTVIVGVMMPVMLVDPSPFPGLIINHVGP